MKGIGDLLSTAREEELHREEWRLRLALLKENSDYRNFWDKYGGEKVREIYKKAHEYYEKNPDGCYFRDKSEHEHLAIFHGRLREEFGIDIGGYLSLFKRDEWLYRLDPYKENDDAVVSFYYPLPAISLVIGGPSENLPEEHRFSTAFPSKKRGNELKPSERLLRVDLSRKRGELKQEFELFLDLVEAFRRGGDCPKDWKENYQEWEPDNSRFRSEAWQALKVWRLRRQRKAYKEIKNTLNIEISTAKMAFRRAYELVERRPYDSEKFKRENLSVNTKELLKFCATCPDNPKNGGDCHELCPDVIFFVDQDTISQRELTIDTLDPYGPEAEDI
jgi:hypothetical protein